MKNFLKSESGAMTVDWVVITVGVVGLGVAIGSALTPVVTAQTEVIADGLCGQDASGTNLTWDSVAGTCS